MAQLKRKDMDRILEIRRGGSYSQRIAKLERDIADAQRGLRKLNEHSKPLQIRRDYHGKDLYLQDKVMFVNDNGELQDGYVLNYQDSYNMVIGCIEMPGQKWIRNSNQVLKLSDVNTL